MVIPGRFPLRTPLLRAGPGTVLTCAIMASVVWPGSSRLRRLRSSLRIGRLGDRFSHC